MMKNLLSAIVMVVLVGTFMLAPASPPTPAGTSRAPAESLAAAPIIDGSAARAAIEASGYRDVSDLVKATDGTWRARAYIGTAEVQLIVDASGRVVPD